MTQQTERVRLPLPEPRDERLLSSGKTLRRQRGDRRFNSGQPLHDLVQEYVLLAWQRGQCTSFVTRTMPVLVLNASYEPVNITRARRALVLLIKGVAVIEEAHDRFVHVGLQLPCVIRLRQYRRLPSRIQTLSRKNILIRDGHICQYCGEKFLSGELELEHVIPRARGGLSTWENLVAACRDCNARKADRTPAEAGMKLLRQPHRVTIHTSRAFMRQTGIGEEKWRKYLYY